MSRILLTLALLSNFALAEDATDVQLHWKPKCSQAKLDAWTKAFTSCADKLPSKKICQCVADGLVQKPDCKKLALLSENKAEREKYEKELAKSCR